MWQNVLVVCELARAFRAGWVEHCHPVLVLGFGEPDDKRSRTLPVIRSFGGLRQYVVRTDIGHAP